MRTTTNISVTMTPSMLEEARRLAKQENRTMSELIREALRRYQQEQRWEGIRLYGDARAAALGLEPKDVVPLIREYRREQRAKRRKKKTPPIHAPGCS